MKQKSEWFRNLWERYRFALLVALAGIILLILPSGGGGSNESSAELALTDSGDDSIEALEKEMEDILSKIDGVGELHLMLTMESSEELQLAQNADVSADGDSFRQSTETVTLSDGTVITRRDAPVCRGALAVCTGGDNAAVRLAVTEAISALTGLRSDRITVIKCQ